MVPSVDPVVDHGLEGPGARCHRDYPQYPREDPCVDQVPHAVHVRICIHEHVPEEQEIEKDDDQDPHERKEHALSVAEV